jgi:hypothetical protein
MPSLDMVSCSGSVVVKLVPTLNTTFYPGFCNIILELGCFNTVVIVVCRFQTLSSQKSTNGLVGVLEYADAASYLLHLD